MALPDRTELWRRFIARRTTFSRDIRGPGWSGFSECAREFLLDLDLSSLRFGEELTPCLDEQTERLVSMWTQVAGGTGGHAWALSRKTINWYLADAVHHVHGRKAFGDEADLAARSLEIPLDRKVAESLLGAVRPGNHWPRGQGVSFPGLRDLGPEVHKAWQDLAADIAESRGLTRPELAVLFLDEQELEVDLEELPVAQHALAAIRGA